MTPDNIEYSAAGTLAKLIRARVPDWVATSRRGARNWARSGEVSCSAIR